LKIWSEVLNQKVSKPFIVVLTGPSGVGKSSVTRELMRRKKDLVYSVSVTTRKIREGEVDGEDYFFVTREGFTDLIENDELIEWAEVYGEFYGTPKKYIERLFERGKHVLIDADTQGGTRLRARFEDGVFIFLLPPSFEVLIERLHRRGTDSEEVKQKRIESAGRELEEVSKYTYAVVNDVLEETVQCVLAIISSEEQKVGRVSDLSGWIDRLKGMAVP